MKNYQHIKPKYWIFHNITSDDLFISTASKSYDNCDNKAKTLYPNEYEEFELSNSNYKIGLFQIDIIIE